ncbi:MAG: hypothetical protein ACREUX_01935 [Burkholderiales bacterium]
MARERKAAKARTSIKELTVSHRERLIKELRADPKLAAEYLNAAAEDDDPRVYLARFALLPRHRAWRRLRRRRCN